MCMYGTVHMCMYGTAHMCMYGTAYMCMYGTAHMHGTVLWYCIVQGVLLNDRYM